MRLLQKVFLGWKALFQLGAAPVINLAIYRLGLITGHYARRSKKIAAEFSAQAFEIRWPIKIPGKAKNRTILIEVIRDADTIIKGEYKSFGGTFAKIDLSPKAPLADWTQYESHPDSLVKDDIKFTWEPARFGWAIQLACAWIDHKNKSYEEAFWRKWEEFLSSNPSYFGPNWISGQEAAIRLISVAFASSIFRTGEEYSSNRNKLLVRSIEEHAERIALTLPYSRAQDNNHYLIEGIGLYTAGWMIPDHPKSKEWITRGWAIVMDALPRQIADNGTYCQHSMNYHRLMLQSVLWFYFLITQNNQEFPTRIAERLRSATSWYLAQLDPISGKAPNLGANDGSLLFPIGNTDFNDHRPTAQAASIAFMGRPCLHPGTWDMLSSLMGFSPTHELLKERKDESPAVYKLARDTSWATLRAVKYSTRPSQADQLHVELWRNGENLLLDAGTFQYNAKAPWDNTFAGTAVHNTVTIDDLDQMSKAGRFLWLDWAQARVIRKTDSLITAEHDGYKRLGVLHRRTLESVSGMEWKVVDELQVIRKKGIHLFRLHWLIAEGKHRISGNHLDVQYPKGGMSISVTVNSALGHLQLIRAGEVISGSGATPVILGWYSPTYGVKIPALSLRLSTTSSDSVQFTTIIKLTNV